ncbi:MAG: redoxin family protein [Thermomicrobiales bacterium]
MKRRVALAAVALIALAAPFATPRVLAQETTRDCASATWLEPLQKASDSASQAAPNDAPPWLAMELTDACSGTTFSLADFAGKTIYVEPMATWCTNCRAQLGRVREASAQIPEAERDDIVLVALSSEVELPREDLATYAAETEFPMIFAVMSADMLRAMVDDLGQEIAVPPAMPHFTIAPDGTVSDIATGEESPEALLARFAALEVDTAS